MKNETREGLLEIIAENDVFVLGTLKKDKRNLTTGDLGLDYYIKAFIKKNIIYKVEKGIYAKVGILPLSEEIKKIKFFDKKENIIKEFNWIKECIEYREEKIINLDNNKLELFNKLKTIKNYEEAKELCKEFNDLEPDWYNFWNSATSYFYLLNRLELYIKKVNKFN
jgi:hypothetical protein